MFPFVNGLGGGCSAPRTVLGNGAAHSGLLTWDMRTTRLNTPWWHAQDLHLESELLTCLGVLRPLWFPPRMDGGGSFLSEQAFDDNADKSTRSQASVSSTETMHYSVQIQHVTAIQSQ